MLAVWTLPRSIRDIYIKKKGNSAPDHETQPPRTRVPWGRNCCFFPSGLDLTRVFTCLMKTENGRHKQRGPDGGALNLLIRTEEQCLIAVRIPVVGFTESR